MLQHVPEIQYFFPRATFYSASQYSPESRDILRVVTPWLEDQQSESERGNGDGGEPEQQLEACDHEEGEEPEPENEVHLWEMELEVAESRY